MIRNRFGQVSIYVIVALAILVLIVGYFLFTKVILPTGNSNFNEVYQYYDSCIQSSLKEAVDLAGTQGGRVYVPDYIPGSEYAPFSSQFNFLGFGVPYWYYIAGNAVSKEQVPTQKQLETDIARYLNENLLNCDLNVFSSQGYNISLSGISTSISLSESKVSANVNGKLTVEKDGESAVVSSRSVDLQTNLGLLFNEALKIYAQEKSRSFIENYSVDVLHLYAPVDGTLIQCSPGIWKTQEIKDNLTAALEGNLAAVQFRSKTGNSDYFNVGFDSRVESRVLYSSKWPQVLEITGDGAGNGALIAQPVGNQEGMGVMGFCYVPYHFVYNWRFPVLIQLMAGDELFQFPVVGVIDKNMPRSTTGVDLIGNTDDNFDFCQYKTQDVSVKTYDSSLNPIDTRIKYSCFDQECDIGTTTNGVLDAKLPACVNGNLIAEADGYAQSSVLFSSNSETLGELILDKLYNVSVSVNVGGTPAQGMALVSFSGKMDGSAMIPASPNLQLAEGEYNVTVYAYGNSSIVIPASSTRQCVEANSGGLAGLFGATEEKCFDVSSPETKIESALIGGGKSDAYLLPSDLQKGKLIINVDAFKTPTSLAELQNNFAIFDTKGVEVTS